MNEQHPSLSPPLSRTMPGPAELRHYPAHGLVAWQPKGVLDDRMLDEIAEWLCCIEKASDPFKRYIDFSRLTDIAVRTSHVFHFAKKRSEQFAGTAPVRSALFSEDWVGFGISRLYESLMEDSSIDARAFRARPAAAEWLGVPVEVLYLTDEPAQHP